jgi:hypothetical protein
MRNFLFIIIFSLGTAIPVFCQNANDGLKASTKNESVLNKTSGQESPKNALFDYNVKGDSASSKNNESKKKESTDQLKAIRKTKDSK